MIPSKYPEIKAFPEIPVEQAVIAAGGKIFGDKVSCFNKSGHNNGDKNPSGYFVKGKDGKTRYHCHCGAGGDGYDVQKQSGLFVGEIKKTPFKKIKPSETRETDPVFQSKVLSFVWDLTPSTLPEKVKTYLQTRGFLNFESFRYMDWKNSVQIAENLRSKFLEKDLLRGKFIKKSKRGEYYFPLQNRVLIPWFDESGKVQFLQGRTYDQ